MTTYAVTAVGPDAPGRVAGLAAALAGLGANLEDASMTRLRGHFAMTLVAAVDAPVEAVERALATTGLHVSVWDVSDDEPAPAAAKPYRVVLHGADRPGIVAAVAGVLARAGGNITDLQCRLAGDLYVMTLDVDLPGAEGIADRLAEVAADLGVVLRLDPADEDVL